MAVRKTYCKRRTELRFEPLERRVLLAVVDLVTSISGGRNPSIPLQETSYEIRVQNQGTTPVENAVLRTANPAVLENTSWSHSLEFDLGSLDGVGGFKITGADQLGTAISSAGDFNGDGFGDFIVGMPDADVNGVVNAGAAFFVYGTDTGFPSGIELDISGADDTYGFPILGTVRNGRLGRAISSAGDVNGDGFDDLLIGVPGAHGPNTEPVNEAYLVYGTNDPFPSRYYPALSAPVAIGRTGGNGSSGSRVSAAGDVNGDGFDDLLLADEFDIGEAYVVFGAPNLPSTIDLGQMNGTDGFAMKANSRTNFGFAISSAGDLNDDGFADIVATATHEPFAGSRSGAAYVVFGKAGLFAAELDVTNLNGTDGFVIAGPSSFSLLGYSVSDLGDFNGDGIDDLVVGASHAEKDFESTAGESYVIFGSSTSFPAVFDVNSIDGINGIRLSGTSGTDRSGHTVKGVGDVDGDGRGDLIISAPYANPNGANDGGKSFLIHGFASSSPAVESIDLTTHGTALVDNRNYARSGFSVGGAVDINGDGLSDILIGAPGFSVFYDQPDGDAYVLYGFDPSVNSINSGSYWAAFDLAPGFSAVRTYEGRIPSTASGELVMAATVTLPTGDTNVDASGLDTSLALPVHSRSVDLKVDIDQNVQELEAGGPFSRVVTVQNHSTFNAIGTEIEVDFGGEVRDLIWTRETTTTILPAVLDLPELLVDDGFTLSDSVNDFLGSDVDDLGDVNGDGLDDIAISSRDAVYVMFGTGSNSPPLVDVQTLNGTNGFKITGGAAYIRFGFVDGAGDINNDGIDDILVTDWSTSSAHVIYGSTNGFAAQFDTQALDGANGFTISTSTSFWEQAEGIGDINDDGIDDLALASFDGGFVHVLYGSNAPFPASVDADLLDGTNGFEIIGSGRRLGIGYSVSGVQDFNGDGIADLAIQLGAYTFPDLYVLFGSSSGFAATTDLGVLPENAGLLLEGVDQGVPGVGNVTDAGDLNGDGINDIAVGAFRAANTAGRTYVVFGATDLSGELNAAELNGNNGFVINGDTGFDQIGQVLDSAGDFNGDGLDDLLIGASDGPIEGRNETASYVLFGSKEGFEASIDLSPENMAGTAMVIAAPDRGGRTNVSAAGDVNGDGIDDILVGDSVAANAGGDVIGKAFVIYGRKSVSSVEGTGPIADVLDLPPGTNVTYTVDGTVATSVNDSITSTVIARATTGNSELNPIDNIASRTEAASPVVDVLIEFGNPPLEVVPLEEASYELRVTNHGGLPASEVKLTSDVQDLLANSTWTRIPSLELANLGQASGVEFTSRNFEDDFSLVSTTLGDINGDGIDDFAFGAPADESINGPVYVVFGSTDGLHDVRIDLLDGTNGFLIPNAWVTSISGAGDVNADGIDDFVVGAADRGNPKGEAFVIFGRTSGFQATLDLSTLDGGNGFRMAGVDDFSGFGASVTHAGDINGDGISDIAIGASSHRRSDLAGKAFVLFGSNAAFAPNFDLASLDGTNGFVIAGNPEETFGGNASGLGDINGDGFDDLAISAPQAQRNGRQQAGAVFIVFGNNTGFASTIDSFSFDGSNGGVVVSGGLENHAGVSVDGIGDFNADGVNDFAISATGSTAFASGNGAAYVVFGSSTRFTQNLDLASLDPASGFEVVGKQARDAFGYSVSSAGDFNADGVQDLFVSAPGEGIGAAYVIFGSSEPIGARLDLDESPTRVLRIGVEQKFDDIRVVSKAGDVNGDGIDDLIVGSHTSIEPTLLSNAYVVFGSANIPTGTASTSDNLDDTFSLLPGYSISYQVTGQTISTSQTQLSATSIAAIVGQQDADLVNNTAALSQTVLPRTVDLDISWVDADSAFSPGSTFERILEVRNTGPFDAFDSTLNVSFDANLQNVTWTRQTNPVYAPISEIEVSAAADGMTFVGGQESAFIGYSTSILPGFDGDGFSDIAVTAGTAVSVMYGSSTNESAEALLPADGSGFLIHGPANWNDVGDAGDFNNDGISDLLISTDFPHEAAGAYVIFGTPEKRVADIDVQNLSPSDGIELYSSFGDIVGDTSFGLGDVNGDGIDDIAVVARPLKSSDLERVYIAFGSSAPAASIDLSTFDGSSGFVIEGQIATSIGVGDFAASAGDVNHDGLRDLMVVRDNRQTVAVVYGQTQFDAIVDPWNQSADRGFLIHDFNGNVTDVNRAGDFNGDQVEDIVIGSFARAYAIFGSANGFGDSLSAASLNGIAGRTMQSRSDVNVSPAGDFNSDGVDDIAVTSIDAQHFLTVVYGATSTQGTLDTTDMDIASGVKWKSSRMRTARSNSVDGGHDINGDGIPDLIAGIPLDKPFGLTHGGSAFVVFGKPVPAELGGSGNISDTIDVQVGSVVRYVVRGTVANDALNDIQMTAIATASGADQHTDSDLSNNVAVLNESVFQAPVVESIIVNDGSDQRSLLSSVTVNFDSIVDATAIEHGFRLRNLTSEQPVGTVDVVSVETGGKTTAVLTFSGTSTTDGSLDDGNYQLSILSRFVRSNAVPLDGDNDGVAGGDHLYGTVEADNFFRFFADSDGDRDVDTEDLARFGSTFRLTNLEVGFDPRFDQDQDGDVDAFDLNAFGDRFRKPFGF